MAVAAQGLPFLHPLNVPHFLLNAYTTTLRGNKYKTGTMNHGSHKPPLAPGGGSGWPRRKRIGLTAVFSSLLPRKCTHGNADSKKHLALMRSRMQQGAGTVPGTNSVSLGQKLSHWGT